MVYFQLVKYNLPNYAGHCWRGKDELISDVLQWTPTYGQAKAGRPARTYIQQLCEDTGCSPEDLPEAMNDREKWRERVRDMSASGTTWWWWYYVAHSSVWVSNHTQSEVMHDVLTHHLLRYYQLQWAPTTAWTALVMWYTHRKFVVYYTTTILRIYIYKYTRIQSETWSNIMTTSTNERTHFFLKIYLSHFILERVMFVMCERWAGDRDWLLHWPKFFWP